MTNFSPREIVSELDRHIVGQRDAKRAVAVALRNRWRRQQLPDDLREEVLPKNILMIGPTGVGKTEIARRLARLLASAGWQRVNCDAGARGFSSTVGSVRPTSRFDLVSFRTSPSTSAHKEATLYKRCPRRILDASPPLEHRAEGAVSPSATQGLP